MALHKDWKHLGAAGMALFGGDVKKKEKNHELQFHEELRKMEHVELYFYGRNSSINKYR